jgi:hypothetical protein
MSAIVMREIKFRTWDKGIETMRPWEKIQHINIGYLTSSSDQELMQFTGLHDKNGKRIYEGDIIEFHRAGAIIRRAIEWDYDRCGWSAVYRNRLDIEVIGNIYENRAF